jgi:hypothetical protein
MSTIGKAPPDVPALAATRGAPEEAASRVPPAPEVALPRHLPLAASRSPEVVAYALVDAEAYGRLAGYCWRLQGTPTAPGFVSRYQPRRTGAPHERTYHSLAQEILGQVQRGRITFRNGNRLDFRRANLLTPQARQAACAAGAQALQAATWLRADAAGAGWERLPLSSDWSALMETAWLTRVAAYHWGVSRSGRNLYVTHQLRLAPGRTRSLSLTRVLMGLQRLDDGASLGPGVVTMRTPPDRTTRTFDLRASNLLVTTRGGINLRRPTQQPYPGVHQQGQRYRAYLKFDGHDQVIGLYNTPEAVAQAREAALNDFGLATLARTQRGEAHT